MSSNLTNRQLRRLRALHSLFCGGATPAEREATWGKLDAFLRKRGKTWNDVPQLLAESNPAPTFEDPRDAEPPGKQFSNVKPADGDSSGR
jgi:hypothetical protein